MNRHSSPLSDVKEAKLLWQTTTMTDKWGYAIKSDGPHRKSLIIDDSDYPDGACVGVWAIEPQRLDVLEEMRSGRAFRRHSVRMNIGGQLTCAWTRPVLLVLALRLAPEAVLAFRQSVALDGGDPNERLHGFMLAPPAPHGLEWKVLGKVKGGGTQNMPPEAAE
jgi:hypothetical protein